MTTLVHAFQKTAAEDPGAVALRTPGDEIVITWAGYAAEVERLAGALWSLGLRPGETVALMLGNRPEFHLLDTAALHLGAIPFSIYNTSSPEQIGYLLGHAGARIAFTEEQFAGRIKASGVMLDHLIDVADLAGLPALEVFDFEATWRAVAPDLVVTLIYTSGTTGPPKGVEITHRTVLAEAEMLSSGYEVLRGDRIISYLPSAHAVDRVASHYFNLLYGTNVTCVADPGTLGAVLAEVRPTVWAAVPRVWEKIKTGIQLLVAAIPDEAARRGTEGAFALGLAKVRLEQTGQRVPEDLARDCAVAEELVLSGIRTRLGLDELRYAFSGAASIPVETLEFFLALGVPIIEAWGMSELTAVATANPREAIRIGTVGTALPGIELRLAGDGELLVRGPILMKGYRGDPVRTAEAIDADGWLHTGDVATIDADGYVTLIDRKKELIISAGGKNMSPANIENTLRSALPLAGGVVVIGDGRSYNVALIVLEPDAAASFAARHGLPADPALLAGDPRVRAAVQAGVDAGNARLSRVEQIKRFAILGAFWEPGGDELTPTMKLRRKPIAAKYAAEIASLYSS
ncbi:MAG: AMP-dependent synthetase/ligase [Streptosporangiaceae bacterium]